LQPESYFTQLSVPLARTAKNFAPRKPIEDTLRNKKPNKQPSKFEKAFREWFTAKLNYEKASRNEAISAAQLVALFRKGNQLGVYRRPYGAPGYYVRPLVGDDVTRQTAMNIMTFHSQVCESKVMASNPSVNMRAGDDTPEAIASAQACRPVVDCYETEWYTAKFSRREAIRFLTDGMVIYQVRWNPFKGGYSIGERTVSQKEVQIDNGEGQCADCQFEGEASEFQQTDFGYQCQCGSSAVDVRPPMKQMLSQIGMGQARQIGEPELMVSSFISWHWDMRVDLECSPWAIKRQRITQGAVNLMLGDVNIPDSGSSEDYGLDVLHALAYTGQAMQGQSYAAQFKNWTSIDNQPTMFEAWLSPEDQAMIEVEEGETLCGVTMPKGNLAKFFKGQPCCVVGLNDGALIVGMFANETHQDDVITAQWFMDADSGGGRGLEDTAAVQRRFNQVDGQIYQGLAMTATPSVLLDKSILKEDDGKYLFRPGQNIDVNLSMLPPNTKLQDAFYLPQPGNVSQQYVNYGSVFLKQMADMSSLAVEFSETLLSIDNRTATGAQITAGLANSLYGPMLMSKGEVRVEIAKKIVALVSAHAVAGRYYPGKGAAKGRMVAGEDLRGKVVFELVQNSQLPVTPFSQQTDIRVALESLGGVQGLLMLKQSDPVMLRQLLRPFTGITLDPETDDDISNLCLERLEQMKQNIQAGVDDPNMLVQMLKPPVSVYEPKHPEKKAWWSDWLDLDSAQRAPMILRAAAEAMYNLHLNYEAQKQMPQAANQGLVQGVGAAAMQAPTALGASMLQQQQPEPQQEDKSAEIEADVAMDHAKHETDLQMKQMESETQLAVAKQQGENQLATTKLAGENQIKVEKAKPKPIVRKTA
jgi:hypothetical protein